MDATFKGLCTDKTLLMLNGEALQLGEALIFVPGRS
jgi:hypothetical protein